MVKPKDIIKSLKEYIKEWETWLDSTLEYSETDFKECYSLVKRQYKIALEKTKYDVELGKQLDVMIASTLLKIREKELELITFKDNNVKEILIEDSEILLAKRRKTLLSKICQELPLITIHEKLKMDVRKVYSSINNQLFYKKELVKKLVEYQDELKKVSLGISSNFDLYIQKVTRQINFLSMGRNDKENGNGNDIVSFVVDNEDTFNSHTEFLLESFELLRELTKTF